MIYVDPCAFRISGRREETEPPAAGWPLATIIPRLGRSPEVRRNKHVDKYPSYLCSGRAGCRAIKTESRFPRRSASKAIASSRRGSFGRAASPTTDPSRFPPEKLPCTQRCLLLSRFKPRKWQRIGALFVRDPVARKTASTRERRYAFRFWRTVNRGNLRTKSLSLLLLRPRTTTLIRYHRREASPT